MIGDSGGEAHAPAAKRTAGVELRELSERIRRFVGERHPTKLLLFGYASYIIVGWLLLCLPFSQAGTGVSSLDNLFTATSAVSTTGLTTTSVAGNYSFLGQVIVLLLIQLGGIGYMTFGSFIILSRKSELPPTRAEVGKVAFSLPEPFDIRRFIRSVVAFTFIIELSGALALYFALSAAGQNAPVWGAVFHSISSFCTAGFSLYDSSFESHAANFWLNAIIAALSYLGAIGFIVCVDSWRVISGKAEEMTLTSRIILWSTFWLTVGGTLLLFLGEPAIRSKPLDERIMAAFFQAMTAMTTVGFNTIGIGGLAKTSVLLIIILMVIGSSPSGTGGGLKCTTFSAVLGVMRSTIRGEKDVRFWGRPIPIERVWAAVATLAFYLTALIMGTYLLEMTEASSFDENLFEAASALGTVGLSMGITPVLTAVGKCIVIALMFCGRLGPLTFGMALFCRSKPVPEKRNNDLAI